MHRSRKSKAATEPVDLLDMNEIEPVLSTSTGNGRVPDPFAAPVYGTSSSGGNAFESSSNGGYQQQQQLQQNTMANSAANSAAASGFADFSKLQLNSVSSSCNNFCLISLLYSSLAHLQCCIPIIQSRTNKLQRNR
jgi:hypothetical protein